MQSFMDMAWQIARKVVEEGQGRYGIDLLVGIKQQYADFSLSFFDPETGKLVSHHITSRELASDYEPVESISQMLFHYILRAFAEKRSERHRENL